MATIDLTVDIPSLPEGWSGTPDELLEFFAENALFQMDGEAPAIQIGGTRPTQDVGIWFSDNSVEKFRDGKYRSISDVPIGTPLPFAGNGGVPPENYIFCTGQSLLRSEFPELFAVIGVVYGNESDTTFNVPDYRGRAPVGSGTGNYAKSREAYTGSMREVVIGEYYGVEWIRNIAKPPGCPSQARLAYGALDAATANYSETTPPHIGQQFILRYR